MIDLSKEQVVAREYISLYEGGSTLTCHLKDGALWIESDTGTIWIVYREGRVVREPDGWVCDADELENRIMHPSDYTTDEDYEPFDVPVCEIPGDVSDFHSDRMGEMWDERQKLRDDQDHFRQYGEAA